MVEETREIVAGMQSLFVHPEELEKLKQQLAQFLRKENSDLDALKYDVGNAISEVKEHLRTGLEAAASHFSVAMDNLADKSRDEIMASANLRHEIEHFSDEVQHKLEEFEAMVQKATERSEEISAELRN